MQSTPTALAILTYHSLDSSGSVVSIAPQRFRDQMAALRDLGIRALSMRDALAHRERHGTWPGDSVVLTFDDGYASVFEHAFPTLTAYGFHATVYVVSDHIGGDNTWAPPPPRLGPHALLTWAQVRELAAHEIEIGAHSCTHPDLRALPRAAIEEQMTRCRSTIAEQIGRPAESFAYPFGGLNRMIVAIAARHFRSACTTVLRRAADDPLHLLPRIDMYYIGSRSALARLLAGRLDGYLTLRRWARRGRGLLAAAGLV
jgi:peptidoglycan/xylan/chitin deacetylase (PgdA/CDA1 family)